MKKNQIIKYMAIFLFAAFALTTSNICTEQVVAEPVPVQSEVKETNSNTTDPLDIVNSPKTFLNRDVIMHAQFDKFSTLGLDYKSAFKSSEEYISFLIKRPDTKYDIPLSEMKLFMKRQEAEKFIDLKTNDEIEINGNVFSDALGDAWIDVKSIKILKKAPEKDGEV